MPLHRWPLAKCHLNKRVVNVSMRPLPSARRLPLESVWIGPGSGQIKPQRPRPSPKAYTARKARRRSRFTGAKQHGVEVGQTSHGQILGKSALKQTARERICGLSALAVHETKLEQCPACSTTSGFFHVLSLKWSQGGFLAWSCRIARGA